MPELAEAASRTGDVPLVRTVLEWLSECTSVTPTDWVLGIEARVRAFLSEDDAAERWYLESIKRLGQTEIRAQLARSHLLSGSGCAARTAGPMPASSSVPPIRC